MSSKDVLCSRRFFSVSQTSAARFLSVWRGKEVEWKKGSSRPLRPHGSGRRAVGQEPAGLSRAYLWSAFSSLPSEELLRSGPNLCMPPSLSLLLLHQFSLSLPQPDSPYREKPKTSGRDALSLHLSSRSSSSRASFPRLFILVGCTHEKGSPLFTGTRQKLLATSAERFTAARHTLARMNDFHPVAPSHSDAQA